ncbi:MAG: DUF951 domain-containing protein [Firmicutes bacterium]|nr:DUF951 domain-containing protein [Bacillota bacterium]
MYKPGDVVELKKPHPCGSNRWTIIRVGMDFRFQCQNCKRSVLVERKKAEKAIKKLLDSSD